MLDINALPALTDNYIWIATPGANNRVAVVDPGEAAPVHNYISNHNLEVGAYLITHHHADHVGGLAALRETHPAPVYGPAREADRIGPLDYALSGGDRFRLDFLDLDFEIIDVPGHTLGHIAYLAGDILFAGDTLFRAGCGRVFEGTHGQMQQSLARLKSLPGTTRVYAGHEYTAANLAFARQVEPGNADIAAALEEVTKLRADGMPTLPTTLRQEQLTNPFLRWDNPGVKSAAIRHAGHDLSDPADIFGVLRKWKNEN